MVLTGPKCSEYSLESQAPLGVTLVVPTPGQKPGSPPQYMPLSGGIKRQWWDLGKDTHEKPSNAHV